MTENETAHTKHTLANFVDRSRMYLVSMMTAGDGFPTMLDELYDRVRANDEAEAVERFLKKHSEKINFNRRKSVKIGVFELREYSSFSTSLVPQQFDIHRV